MALVEGEGIVFSFPSVDGFVGESTTRLIGSMGLMPHPPPLSHHQTQVYVDSLSMELSGLFLKQIRFKIKLKLLNREVYPQLVTEFLTLVSFQVCHAHCLLDLLSFRHFFGMCHCII